MKKDLKSSSKSKKIVRISCMYYYIQGGRLPVREGLSIRKLEVFPLHTAAYSADHERFHKLQKHRKCIDIL